MFLAKTFNHLNPLIHYLIFIAAFIDRLKASLIPRFVSLKGGRCRQVAKTRLGGLECKERGELMGVDMLLRDGKATVIQVSIDMHSPNGFKHILID
ncbi:hypothetical protein HID58_006374 [Brassica napus]|uniref:Uncharacterized protein n=2 Tax=Brassica TaxID=3705 RepID=M4DPR8_BRACM|nr:hypothetical protein HID58_006374 [Brassica napus]CAF2141422.1 unnamed protein product [Brassica napus]